MTATSPDPSSPPRAARISIEQAATLLGITGKWVRELARRGYIDGLGGGTVPLVGAIQGYIRWLKDEERRASKSAGQSAVSEARAREITLRNAREEGRLIDIEDAEATAAEIIAVYRQELSGVAAASTHDPELRASIDGRLNDLTEQCGRRFARALVALRSGAAVEL